jgi:hypothetical protein
MPINKNKEKGMSHNKAARKADGTRLAQAVRRKKNEVNKKKK